MLLIIYWKSALSSKLWFAMIYIYNMRIKQKLKGISRWSIVYQKIATLEMLVLCFGLFGKVRSDALKCLRKFSRDKVHIKKVLKWCFIPIIIGSNYVWTHRVKKLLVWVGLFIFFSFVMFSVKVFNLLPQYDLVQHHVKAKDLVCFFVYLFVYFFFFNLSCTFIFDSYTYMLLLN